MLNPKMSDFQLSVGAVKTSFTLTGRLIAMILIAIVNSPVVGAGRTESDKTESILPGIQVVTESEFRSRKLVQLSHDSHADWGYQKPQSDSFYLVHPKTVKPNSPLCVVLHSAGGKADESLKPTATQHHDRGFYGDDSFYILCLDCFQNQNDWWWGHKSIESTPNEYQDKLSPTEKRVLASVEWAIAQHGIDRNRVYLNGISMGGSGSLGIGLIRGDVFASVAVIVPAFVKHQQLRSQMGSTADPPVLINFSSQLDPYAEGQELLLQSCQQQRYPMVFAWGPFGHTADVSSTNPAVFEFPWLKIRKDEAYPVFTKATTDNRYPGFKNSTDPDQSGQINGYFRWKSVEDSPARVVTDLRIVAPEELKRPIETPDVSVAQVTLRRLQKFSVKPGAKYHWTRSSDTTIVESGTVTADERSLVTVPELVISKSGTRFTVVPVAE